MGYFPYSNRTVITHRPNTEIWFRLYCISMELSVSRPRRSVISGSLWWSFTRTYSSHQFCPSLRWTSRVWLAGSWGRLIGSELRLARPRSSLEKTWTAGWPLEVSRACCDKWAFSSMSHRPFVRANRRTYMHVHAHTHAQKGSTHTLLPSSAVNTASLQNSCSSAACRLGFQI